MPGDPARRTARWLVAAGVVAAGATAAVLVALALAAEWVLTLGLYAWTAQVVSSIVEVPTALAAACFGGALAVRLVAPPTRTSRGALFVIAGALVAWVGCLALDAYVPGPVSGTVSLGLTHPLIAALGNVFVMTAFALTGALAVARAVRRDRPPRVRARDVHPAPGSDAELAQLIRHYRPGRG